MRFSLVTAARIGGPSAKRALCRQGSIGRRKEGRCFRRCTPSVRRGGRRRRVPARRRSGLALARRGSRARPGRDQAGRECRRGRDGRRRAQCRPGRRSRRGRDGRRGRRLACEAHRGGGLRCDARPRPDERDPAAELRGLTEGRGADFVFVTVGRSDVIERAIGYTRRGGTVVVVGTPPSHETFGVVAVDLVHDDVRIVGSKIGSGSGSFAGAIARLVRLYEDGRLKLDELVTARYPLARINDAIAAAHGDALRNVIVFDRE
ncbi:MAG: zinc-binding dehydrogenase [Actinobacteria bacterium]|nr:MAG: zinc-binding dehydrogenase [Actinomycetota bacterium]